MFFASDSRVCGSRADEIVLVADDVSSVSRMAPRARTSHLTPNVYKGVTF